MNDSTKIFITIFLILFLNLSAQQLHIKNYTTDNGLPSSQVWCSLQDSKGYIWFGTTGGLAKYDGIEFKSYSVEDGLVNNAIRSLFEDNNTLWITTYNGISKYDGKSFTNYKLKDGLGKGIIRSVAKYRGNLWFGTSQGGLSRFKPDKSKTVAQQFVTYTTKDGLPSNNIFPLFSDEKYLWIGTRGGGLSRYDGNVFVNYGKEEGLTSKDIWSLIKVGSVLWIGTGDKGLLKLENGKFHNVIPHGKFYCASKGDSLWFGTFDQGVWLYKDEIQQFDKNSGLINNRILSILIDKENSVWFTTDKGISKLVTNKFVGYLKNNTILSVYSFGNAIWFGTMMEGLIKLENQKLTTFRTDDGLLSNQIWAITSLKNKLWIGTYEGLNSFDGKKFKQYTVREGLPSNIITDLFPIGNNLWIATAGGVSKFDGISFTNLTTNEGLATNHIWSICQDEDKIWFASDAGACCYDGIKFKNYTVDNGLSTNNIRTIFKDSGGFLWFGTSLGINKFDGKNFSTFFKKDGLSNNCVSAIIECNGDLWFGTDKGFNKFKAGKIIKIYTQKKGLIGDESSTPNSLYIDSKQNIWFGTTKGVTKYIQKNDIPNIIPPPIYINNLSVNSSLVELKSNLKFKYKQNNVIFSYVGLSFKDEDDVRYKYKLKGYDKEWSEVTEKTEIRYTNLNNGTYTFMVFARNGDGFWSKTPAEISFKILPPFWKSWWFIIIVLLILIGIVYGVFLLKTAQMRNRAKSLEQKINERTKVLKDSEEKYRTLIEHSNDMIWTLDEKGNFVYFNRKSEEITGHNIEDAIGESFAPIILEEDLEKVKKVFIETMQGKSQHYEVRIYDSKERLLFLSVNTAPIFKNGKVIGTISFGRDITKQKKMEEELLKASKLESLGILAGGIAHDFNNTLTAIIGNLSLAKLQVDSKDKLNNTLIKIEKSLQQAKDLTQQLLTFARGGTPIKKKIFVNDLLKDSASFALRGSNVRCKFLISDNTWPVEVDEEQISQVINNLTMNADQAMPAGGILNISAENISIDKEESLPIKKGNYVKITIKDIGAGIPDDRIQKIFDPYFTTKQKGSGLGLTITYSIIKKHNGYITVKSKPGVGTTFFIYLPASEEKEPSKEKKKKIPLQVGEGKVLVMDDEESVRDIAGEMLKHIGYTVELAEDGKEALELFMKARDSGTPFEVVILDLTVAGGMGGKETIKELIKIDPKAKVIVSSGYSDDPVLSNFRKYGFSEVVSKPYTIQELSAVLHKVYQKESSIKK
jgi:PAS domain S-box-containing protein